MCVCGCVCVCVCVCGHYVIIIVMASALLHHIFIIQGLLLLCFSKPSALSLFSLPLFFSYLSTPLSLSLSLSLPVSHFSFLSFSFSHETCATHQPTNSSPPVDMIPCLTFLPVSPPVDMITCLSLLPEEVVD